MDEILYLEADEEITSVVDKLKGLEANSVGLVAPKGSTIVQSLVSLKLLQKQAKSLGKEVSIVTSDEVGQNLASRINLPVYADVKSRKPIEPKIQKEPENDGPIDLDMNAAAEPVMEASKAETAETAEEQDDAVQNEEDYGDIPEQFEVHRYDDKRGETEKQPENAKVEKKKIEPVENEVSSVKSLSDDSDEQIEHEEKFVQRPVSSIHNRIEDRDELEAARPVNSVHHKIDMANKPRKSKKPAFVIAVCCVFFLALLVLADLAVAKLQVNMSIPAEEIDKTVIVKVDKERQDVDAQKGEIPGTLSSKDIQVDDKFKATGEKDAGNKAKGTLTFKNDSGIDQTVPVGTTVRSTSGVEFVLDKDIIIPKASLNQAGDKVLGQVTGPVTAKDSGIKFNLPSSTSYVISSMSKILISGETTGGTSKKVTIITKSDLDSAKKTLTDKALAQFKDEVSKDKSLVYLEGAQRSDFSGFTSSKDVNDEATEFTASGKLSISAMLFKADDFKAAIVGKVEKDLPEGKSLMQMDTDVISSELNQENINVGSIQVNGEIKSHIGPKVDLSALKKSWKVKPIKRVKSDLEKIEGASVSEVKITPSFALPVTPLLGRNITINIDYTKK